MQNCAQKKYKTKNKQITKENGGKRKKQLATSN